MRDRGRAAPEAWYLDLVFGRDGQAHVTIGDAVEGSYRVAGDEVTVVAPGDTIAARVPLGGASGGTVPLVYGIRRDTPWWRGGAGAPVPLRAWVPSLERERSLPAGAWLHD